jgi:hypothetical protein
MTACSANRPTDTTCQGDKFSYKAAAEKIYAGSLVMINNAGYACAASDLDNNKGIVGIAVDYVDNSSGSAGDLSVTVQKCVAQLVTSGASQAWVGKLCYASDDQTVTITQTEQCPLVGKIVKYVSATSVWAEVNGDYVDSGAVDVSSKVHFFDDFTGQILDITNTWTVADTSSAGAPTYQVVDDANCGVVQLTLASTTEAENVCLYKNDNQNFLVSSAPIMTCRLQIPVIGTATDDYAWGLWSARNDAIDSVATHMSMRLIGASLKLYIESDDGTTDKDDKDTGVTLTAATYYEFKFDTTDQTNLKFFYRAGINGAWVQLVDTAATPATFTWAASTAKVQPTFQVQKTSASTTPSMLIDYVDVVSSRV